MSKLQYYLKKLRFLLKQLISNINTGPLRLHFNKVLQALIPIVFVTLVSVTSYIYTSVQADFKQLTFLLRELAASDQEAYILCAEQNHSNEKYREINLKILDGLTKLTFQHYSMGKLISQDTYKQIHTFAEWNNQLFKSNQGICNQKLKTIEESDEWKATVQQAILKDQLRYQGASNIPSLFYSYLVLKDRKYAASYE